MEISPDVLTYVQNVMTFMSKNEEAKKYFIDNSNEELFFKHLSEIAQKNYKSFGDPTLDKKQFELLRKTIMAIDVVNKPLKVEEIDPKDFDNGIFIELIPNFGMICLN
jgi:hypothetical protein